MKKEKDERVRLEDSKEMMTREGGVVRGGSCWAAEGEIPVVSVGKKEK